MTITTALGYHDAILAAANLDAFSTEDPNEEYSRGQAELIQQLFITGDPDPGSGEAYNRIVADINVARH